MNNIEMLLERKYPCNIIFGRGIISDVEAHLLPVLIEPKVVILTNHLLKRLYGDRLISDLERNSVRVNLIVVANGEKSKDLSTAQKIYDKLLDCKADRSTTLITLGGGVIGDLGGFIAATFMRGIPLIHIPTTLLAQIDSSIGGKVAINHPEAKNIIGGFYPPSSILIDFNVLQSLPEREIKNGLVEAIKIAIISNPDFFNWIKNNIGKVLQKDQKSLDVMVRQAAQEKIDIILRDPWEKNERNLLNLGHTIGHVLETIDNYSNLTHGETVALGILIETRLAFNKKICSEGFHKQIRQILSFISDYFHSEPYSSLFLLNRENNCLKECSDTYFDKFLNILTLDKKNKNGKIVFILPEKLGKVSSYSGIGKEEIIQSLKDFIMENE